MSEHAFLPPSSAHCWVACPAWPTMNATFPETEDREDAREGVAVHWATLIMWGHVKQDDRAPNGVVLTDEMLETVEIATEALEPFRLQAERGERTLHIEQTVRANVVHPEHNWGTPDIWTYRDGVLDIFDLKYGHEYVEVIDNWQLANYAALILALLNITDENTDQRAAMLYRTLAQERGPKWEELGETTRNVWRERQADVGSITVNYHVIQPRCYSPLGPVRSWSTTALDLMPAFSLLREAATLALSSGAEARPGPQCKHCNGRHACKALQVAGMSAIDQAGDVLPLQLPPDALGIELRMLRRAHMLLSARITGLEEQALSLMRQGTRVPHFTIEQSPGREVWTRPVDEIKLLGDLSGVKLEKPGLITPNQARKAGMNPDVVNAYVDRPKTAIKIVPASDADARRVFGSKP